MIALLLDLERDLPTTAEDSAAQRHRESAGFSFEEYLEWLDELDVSRMPRPEPRLIGEMFELPLAVGTHQ